MNDSNEHTDLNNSFPVEKGFFDNLEKSILNKVKQKGYILESGIETPFTVPIGYFTSLENSVLSKTTDQLRVSYKRSMWPIIRVAAVFLAVLSLGVYFINNNNSTIELADLEDEEIVAYLSENEIDTYTLANYTTLEDLELENTNEVLDDLDFQILEEFTFEESSSELL